VPTDILSFPFHTALKAGSRIKAKNEWEKNLGDLILSPEYIHKAALEHEERLEDRLKMLIVHGICHLLGYDHIEDNDYKKMQKKENELLKLIR
jgi:rRNA maturation RNase YbeY